MLLQQPICTTKELATVNKKAADTALEELYEIHKDKPTVKAIDVPGCIREGKAAKDLLLTKANSVDEWAMPCDLRDSAMRVPWQYMSGHGARGSVLALSCQAMAHMAWQMA